MPYNLPVIVGKHSPSSVRCKRINGSSTKTSDLLKEHSVLLKVFSVLPRVLLKVLKDHYEMIGLCGSLLMYTLYLCVKQLNNMFFNVKNLPLAPQYQKDFYKLVPFL